MRKIILRSVKEEEEEVDMFFKNIILSFVSIPITKV
jgi:hypothetical protein